jgi:thymidylate kinase
MTAPGREAAFATPGRDRAGAHETEQFHPVLARVFGQLERRGLTWMLLWFPAVPNAPTGDVDLLVAPSDAPALKTAAAEFGFVPLPGWESGPELILVTYDAESDCWLVLEVMSEISYRSAGWALPEETVHAVLRRRRAQNGLSVPSDDDAFWLLLLHCVLDKGSIGEAYRHRLRRLASAASTSPLGRVVCSAGGAEFDPADLVKAADAERWQVLVQLGRGLAEELRRGVPVRRRLQLLARRWATVTRMPLLLRRRRGPNVALLGPNGVGKSTAAQAVQRSYPLESRVLYMGVWKAANRDSSRAGAVAEIVTRPVRIWARYLLAQYHQLRGRLVIFDRYVYEALLPPQPPLVALKRVYFWALAHLIPRPTAGVVLDVPGHVAYSRKEENPPAELEFERRLYAAAAARVRSLQLVDASGSPDKVRAEVNAIIWRELSERWQ